MSKIGKLPIPVPDSVKVNLTGDRISVEGPKGKLDLDLPPHTSAALDEEAKQIVVSREDDQARSKAMHGLCRSLINNNVVGVAEGYTKKLEIHGTGFKAAVNGNVVNMHLGYSHEINHEIPPQVTVNVERNTQITIEGPDKQSVGLLASELRAYYPVEPYKGKGVRYSDEVVIRKKGKREQ
ncbi:MAG: 50S ribosomal protein L6 [Verrucomicrobiales bacterium]|nr:50S ribosomal protein L6 [Verrucomicrobiales bacterium]|tara:strand:- start:409 stop:951 length:543 start_codon:yes stop_codon:yes gene_type:complete